MISKLQLLHIKRNLEQRAFKVPVGVIGGYHGGNLGDMALGTAVKSLLQDNGIKSGLQTIYNLDKWPKTSYVIVGGGAVGYISSLKKVAERYKGAYDKVALLGVDFMESSYPDDCLDLINGAAYVSGRSEKQSLKLREITGRQDIHHHPDIAYSMMTDFCKKQRAADKDNRPKQMLINLVPLYSKITNGAFMPLEEYRKERPELYDQFNEMHIAYKLTACNTVKKALDLGYEVASIPFTPEDGECAKIMLKGLNVTHLKYDSSPQNMFHRMAKADWAFVTRFHATIFALKLGLKISPIAYATKNEIMLSELGADRDEYLSTAQLAQGKHSILSPLNYSLDTVAGWEIKSTEAILTCIDKLYGKL
jgi:hypothetical protein